MTLDEHAHVHLTRMQPTVDGPVEVARDPSAPIAPREGVGVVVEAGCVIPQGDDDAEGVLDDHRLWLDLLHAELDTLLLVQQVGYRLVKGASRVYLCRNDPLCVEPRE